MREDEQAPTHGGTRGQHAHAVGHRVRRLADHQPGAGDAATLGCQTLSDVNTRTRCPVTMGKQSEEEEKEEEKEEEMEKERLQEMKHSKD